MRSFAFKATAKAIVLLSLLLATLSMSPPSFAQADVLSNSVQSEPAKVGILPAPPFVFKNEQGQWDGLAMGLWNQILDRYDIDYEFVELASPTQALEGIRSKALLTVVSGVNITSAREKYGSFSTPYYVTDMAVAMDSNNRSVYANIIGYLTSPESVVYILVLLGLILAYAWLFFVVESDSNPIICEPGAPKSSNIMHSMIWSIMLATGQDANLQKSKTLLLRFLSMVLFFVGLFTFSAFVAILSSSLTVNKLGVMNFQNLDLHAKRVGVIRDSRSAEYCVHEFIACEPFDNLAQGMAMLKDGKLDVILGQKVELHAEASNIKLTLDYVEVPDRRDYYAFFFRDGFENIDAFNDALMEVVDHPSYAALIRRYVRFN
jgi:ABC-type amino acid transport substrate-binding protein